MTILHFITVFDWGSAPNMLLQLKRKLIMAWNKAGRFGQFKNFLYSVMAAILNAIGPIWYILEFDYSRTILAKFGRVVSENISLFPKSAEFEKIKNVKLT